MAVQTREIVAFVHVASVSRSIEFYADLGFRVKNSVVPPGHAGPVWAWLESGAASLMVGLADEPVDASRQAILFYLYVESIAQAHAGLVERGHAPGPVRHPPHLPRGECRLEDPDGYVLMIAER